MTAVVNWLLEDQTAGDLEEESSSDNEEASPLDEDMGSTILAFKVVHGEGPSLATEINLVDDPQTKPPRNYGLRGKGLVPDHALDEKRKAFLRNILPQNK